MQFIIIKLFQCLEPQINGNKLFLRLRAITELVLQLICFWIRLECVFWCFCMPNEMKRNEMKWWNEMKIRDPFWWPPFYPCPPPHKMWTLSKFLSTYPDSTKFHDHAIVVLSWQLIGIPNWQLIQSADWKIRTFRKWTLILSVVHSTDLWLYYTIITKWIF